MTRPNNDENDSTTGENSSAPGSNDSNAANKNKSKKKDDFKEPRGNVTTEIKTEAKDFIPIWGGAKTFLITKKEDYQVNDFIWFAEMKGKKRTGRRLWVKITYTQDVEQAKDSIAMSFKILNKMQKQ